MLRLEPGGCTLVTTFKGHTGNFNTEYSIQCLVIITNYFRLDSLIALGAWTQTPVQWFVRPFDSCVGRWWSQGHRLRTAWTQVSIGMSTPNIAHL